MSEFEGARFSMRLRYSTTDGGSVTVPVSTGAIEITKLPRRKRPCLIMDTGDGVTWDILAYFSSDEDATKFIEFMDKFAVTK